MDDISFSKRRKNRGYTYLCAGSVICVSLLRAPQYSTFACCLIPVLTLVVLLVMLDDIDDISFSKRRYFLIVSWMSISVYCIPTRDTHITRDMCMGIHQGKHITVTAGYSTRPCVIAGSSFHNSDCRSMPSNNLCDKYSANSLLNITICWFDLSSEYGKFTLKNRKGRNMEELSELFEKLKLNFEQTKEVDLGSADSIITALQRKEGKPKFLIYKT